MVIECPYCATRFRLDERSLGDRRPTLRCSHCRRTFPLPPSPERDEDFTYDDPEADDPQAEEEADDGDDDAAPPRPVVAPRPAPYSEQFPLPMRRDREDQQPSLFGNRESVQLDEEEYSIDAPDELLVEDDLDSDSGEDSTYAYGDDDEFEESAVSHAVRIRSLLAFIALVVGGYALLAWTLRNEPQWARSVTQQIPLLGSEINAIELGREIVLDGLQGRYDRTKEGKLIFLITGNARNEHDQAVRGIRVEFKLLGSGGVTLARQSTTCGNAMRPDLVRDLTEEQVRILRGWGTKPPEETTVKPGDACPIVSIFMDVSEDAASFSGEVVQAHRLS